MAKDAYLLGRRLYAEKAIRDDNLSKAIERFQEAERYLDAAKLKPEFYSDFLTGLEDSRKALQMDYEECKFRADRAIRLRDWDDAIRSLNVICSMIPNPSDPRHAAARTVLLGIPPGRSLTPTSSPPDTTQPAQATLSERQLSLIAGQVAVLELQKTSKADISAFMKEQYGITHSQLMSQADKVDMTIRLECMIAIGSDILKRGLKDNERAKHEAVKKYTLNDLERLTGKAHPGS